MRWAPRRAAVAPAVAHKVTWFFSPLEVTVVLDFYDDFFFLLSFAASSSSFLFLFTRFYSYSFRAAVAT